MTDRTTRNSAVHEMLKEGIEAEIPTRLRIRGSCMSPLIAAGASVTVLSARWVVPGDVIVFRSASDFVAHRVLGFRPGLGGAGVVTRGDHCVHHDGVIPRDRIVGKIDVAIPLRQRIAAMLSFVRLVFERTVRRG